ncbi:hypothetical protein AA0115_g11420 [Alternaria tenuissima]|uniref:Ubiquitin 3 binding protein But2 C-terminal domain-containing protein n=1 Tax=Alternaria tenuissima TaxID=119927 RepID=A0AB37W414_9PLEO|nr:hypothetical protein AA0115_g11420 [Alternaria tenuissima]
MKSFTLALSFISSVYARNNVCSQGANELLVPLLKNYQPAQKYCTSRYPLPVSTQTVTAAAIPITTTDVVPTTTTVVVTTTVVDQVTKRANTTPAINPPQPTQHHGRSLEERNIDAQWSSFLKEAKQVVQTLCSCIETPRTSTVTATPTTLVTVTATQVVIATTVATVIARACPTSTSSFALFASASNSFATVNSAFDNLFSINFRSTTAAGAAQFFFTDSCRLSVVGSSSELSVVVDSPGQFVYYHYVWLTDPTMAQTYDEAPVACVVSADLTLTCSVRDQNVLQLFGDQLSIAASNEGTASSFTLVPV